MPQFNPEFFAAQLFWLAVIFTGFYFFMARVALPRLADVLAQRSERITSDLERAEAFKKETDAVIEAYEQALAKARSDAQALIASTKAEISREAAAREQDLNARIDKKLDEAEAEISAAKAQATEQIRDIAGDLAVDITGRLLGQAADRAAADAVVSKELEARI